MDPMNTQGFFRALGTYLRDQFLGWYFSVNKKKVVQTNWGGEHKIWSNYSDLKRPHPKWWFSKGNPLISRKPRLVSTNWGKDWMTDTVDGRNPANQLKWQVSQYLHGFIHPRWCRISSINSIAEILAGGFKYFFYFHPYLGKIPILTNIFQMRWNHQPE